MPNEMGTRELKHEDKNKMTLDEQDRTLAQLIFPSKA